MQKPKQEKEITRFDLRDVYKNEVYPLIKKIDLICKASKIPFMFTACVENDEEGSTYKHVGNLCGSNQINLTDDKITDILRIICGFKLKPSGEEDGGYKIEPPGEMMEVDFSEI